MNFHRPVLDFHATLLALVLSSIGAFAIDPPARGSACEDAIKASLVLDPKLDSKFFHKTATSRPWHITGESSEEGSLEDTIDRSIDAEDLILIEHTAHCTSTHQGEHAMDFCNAVACKDGIAIDIYGGMPAYASSLQVLIRPDKTFQCSFEAVYPNATPPLKWKITKKSLKLRSFPLRAGQRLYAWLSVEFDEIDTATGKSESFKIEGVLKPFVQSPKEEQPSPSAK